MPIMDGFQFRDEQIKDLSRSAMFFSSRIHGWCLGRELSCYLAVLAIAPDSLECVDVRGGREEVLRSLVFGRLRESYICYCTVAKRTHPRHRSFSLSQGQLEFDCKGLFVTCLHRLQTRR